MKELTEGAARASAFEAVRIIVLVAICLAVSPLAEADVRVVTGGDEMDETTYSGIGIRSIDQGASIYFLCDSDSERPRIVFANEEFLTSSGNEFLLAYKVDDGGKKNRYFKARPDHKSGRLHVTQTHSHSHIYAEEFGPSPIENERLAAIMKSVEELKESGTSQSVRGERKTESKYKTSEEWVLAIHRQTITDFVSGDSALIRVWDFNRQSFTYRFDLSSIMANLNALKDCYKFTG